MPKVSEEQLAVRRGEILQAARRAFARHGYEGATVKVLEAETGLSRGAIFHHFRDKDALFLALAEQDAARTAEVVERGGLVQVMRELRDRDAGELGVQLEVRRRLRTDPAFAASWQQRHAAVTAAARSRLQRQREAGVVRDDVPLDLLIDFLQLVLDGLVSRRAAGMAADSLDGVLDLVEDAVRRPRHEQGEDAVRRPPAEPVDAARPSRGDQRAAPEPPVPSPPTTRALSPH